MQWQWCLTQSINFLKRLLIAILFQCGNLILMWNSYSGYGIGFDACGSFSLSDDSGFGKNVLIFGSDMSSSVHIDNKKKYILILGKYTTDGSDNTTLTA